MDLTKYVASIENFPEDGIIFRDVTPLMADKEAFKLRRHPGFKIIALFGDHINRQPFPTNNLFGFLRPQYHQASIPGIGFQRRRGNHRHGYQIVFDRTPGLRIDNMRKTFAVQFVMLR